MWAAVVFPSSWPPQNWSPEPVQYSAFLQMYVSNRSRLGNARSPCLTPPLISLTSGSLSALLLQVITGGFLAEDQRAHVPFLPSKSPLGRQKVSVDTWWLSCL